MKNIPITIVTGIAALLLISAPTFASHHEAKSHSHGNHGKMDHNTMENSMESSKEKAVAKGIIHRVSRLNRTVNLTHDPVPDLNWPAMTMDLKVAESIDLTTIEIGKKVTFHLELGEDKQYIITHIMQ